LQQRPKLRLLSNELSEIWRSANSDNQWIPNPTADYGLYAGACYIALRFVQRNDRLG